MSIVAFFLAILGLGFLTALWIGIALSMVLLARAGMARRAWLVGAARQGSKNGGRSIRWIRNRPLGSRHG